MAKEKRYDVLHSFSTVIDGKKTWITGKNAQDVAKMDEGARKMAIANGRVREYDAPDTDVVDVRDGLPNDAARDAQKALDATHKARAEAAPAAPAAARAKAGAAK